MAACGSLQHIFDKPLESSTTALFDPLSTWEHIKPIKSHDDSSPSFTDMFSELQFKEKIDSVLSSPIPLSIPSSPASSSAMTEFSPKSVDNNNINIDKTPTKGYFYDNHIKQYGRSRSDSFSSMNSESLSMCTEGLGFESFDDVEDLKNEGYMSDQWKQQQQERRRSFSVTTKHAISEILSGEQRRSKISGMEFPPPISSIGRRRSLGSTIKQAASEILSGEPKRSRISGMEFPPPISSIGRSGKPWVCFKSYRNNGRFILKEVRIPTQEFLHACREDGRLKLHFVQSDDEAIDEEEEEEEEEVEERNNADKVANDDSLKVDRDFGDHNTAENDRGESP